MSDYWKHVYWNWETNYMLQSRYESGDERAGHVESLRPELPQWLADLNRSVSALKPHQRIFLTRAVQAVMELTQLDENSLVRAAESSRDIDVLIRALQSPDALRIVQEFEPLAESLLEGITARRELIQEEGGAWSSHQVAEYLGISTQAVNKGREAGRFLGLNAGKSGYLYPVWQFDSGKALHGLRDVIERLSEQDPWMQAIFFLNPHPQLNGMRPLDALRSGEIDTVLEVAATVGEHGAI